MPPDAVHPDAVPAEAPPDWVTAGPPAWALGGALVVSGNIFEFWAVRVPGVALAIGHRHGPARPGAAAGGAGPAGALGAAVPDVVGLRARDRLRGGHGGGHPGGPRPPRLNRRGRRDEGRPAVGRPEAYGVPQGRPEAALRVTQEDVMYAVVRQYRGADELF